MDNFTNFNLTTIDFGTGKEQLIGQHLAEHGIKKVLLCYGSDRIKRDGLFAVVSKSLAARDIQFIECGGIVSNPLLSKVRDAITHETHFVFLSALMKSRSGRNNPRSSCRRSTASRRERLGKSCN